MAARAAERQPGARPRVRRTHNKATAGSPTHAQNELVGRAFPFLYWDKNTTFHAFRRDYPVTARILARLSLTLHTFAYNFIRGNPVVHPTRHCNCNYLGTSFAIPHVEYR